MARSPITIDMRDAQVVAALNALLSRVQNPAPAMRDIGELLAETTKRRFSTATGPDGRPWPANRPSTIERYMGNYGGAYSKKDGRLSAKGAARVTAKKPLTGESRSLGTTINYRAGRLFVEIGSAMEYAATQQFGAKKGAFGRTRKGAPIPWGDIPARPFLGVSAADKRSILEILNEHMGGR